GSTTRAVFEHALQQSGITMGPVMEIGSREGVREAVAAGLGIGIVGAMEFGNDRRLHSITLQGSGLEVTEYAACLEERRMIRTINAFFELFAEK
ncbi:MAG TPA: LysR family transcriptional regulator, partial [Gammaproteobacteria bacterium]|nr:LysR family transcriptional regulator [Gammaproteobacteria bacterium]